MEFSIGDKNYRAARLDAFSQFHISRKLAPILPTLIPVFLKIAKENGSITDIGGLAEVLTPFADGLAAMSNDDSEYVIATCLKVTKRQAGESWTPVWSQSAKSCMFDDMDLGDIIQIVIKVVQDSIGPFIQGLLMSQMGKPE